MIKKWIQNAMLKVMQEVIQILVQMQEAMQEVMLKVILEVDQMQDNLQFKSTLIVLFLLFICIYIWYNNFSIKGG